MGEINNSIEKDILIAKYLSGNMTEQELDEIGSWKEFKEENTKHVKETEDIWQNSNHYISSDQKRQDKIKLNLRVNVALNTKLKKSKRQLLIFKAIAVLAIPVAIAISLLLMLPEGNNSQICEIRVSEGHIAKCFLPDRSVVWINTNSVLRYDLAKYNNKIREVEYEGEVFFDVVKNTKSPFIVNNKWAKIMVTGTKFNAKSYPNTNIFETVLEEGSIELYLKNHSQQKKISLKPGNHVLFNHKEKYYRINNVDPELHSAWRNGKIIFKDATLNDLIAELERMYKVKVVLQNPDVGNTRFRGMFSYNNNIIDALEKIKRTAGLDYKVTNKMVFLK